jgi:hypothetical protein
LHFDTQFWQRCEIREFEGPRYGFGDKLLGIYSFLRRKAETLIFIKSLLAAFREHVNSLFENVD